MHPEVQQEYPGDCPKCGMALELKTVTVDTDDEENVELLDMTKRFWIGAALALPVFVLAMTHLIPALAQQPWADSSASRWLQLALASPVVLWAGWPLLHRGWRSVVTRHLNMFTLISIGVGAAFVFSAVAMLMPGIFPRTMQHEGEVAVYFESNLAPHAHAAAATAHGKGDHLTVHELSKQAHEHSMNANKLVEELGTKAARVHQKPKQLVFFIILITAITFNRH